MDWGSVPTEVEENLRKICLALPETHEQQAWNGQRWLVRKRAFAHVFTVDQENDSIPMMQFRSDPPELDALVHSAELVADSYCIQAPKKLAALVAGDVTPRQ